MLLADSDLLHRHAMPMKEIATIRVWHLESGLSSLS